NLRHPAHFLRTAIAGAIETSSGNLIHLWCYQGGYADDSRFEYRALFIEYPVFLDPETYHVVRIKCSSYKPGGYYIAFVVVFFYQCTIRAKAAHHLVGGEACFEAIARWVVRGRCRIIGGKLTGHYRVHNDID